jgi:hypothetical protein
MLCSQCAAKIEPHPRPLGRPGGKPAYFDWEVLRSLRPGTDDSVLVEQGQYASLLALSQAGRRQAAEMGLKVRATQKSNGVRFWRVK